jgi:hypothetical protein
MKVLGYSVVFVMLIALSALWSGYVLSILWGWFVAGTLGLPQLTINNAIGLAIIVGCMTKTEDTPKDDETVNEKLVRGVVMGALKPSLTLVLGWIVRLFA